MATVTAPETIGIDSTPFSEDPTVVVPLVYVKNPGPNNDLANITNITQRNASYLESASGYLPTAYFGARPTPPRCTLSAATASLPSGR